MKIYEILNSIDEAQGTNAKLAILRSQKDNMLLKKVLSYGLDSFKQFYVVKVPKLKSKNCMWVADEQQWKDFFDAADKCAERKVTGNAAIATISGVFESSDDENEKWMRKILQKHFKIGANLKTIEKVFPGIVKTFEVQLAEKMHDRTFEKLPAKIRTEPKLDGIRILAIVRGGICEMYARSGKIITNFDNTVGKELSTLPDSVYDGEVMDEDFTALMRQARRKTNVNVTESYLCLFDMIPLDEWDARESFVPHSKRRTNLEAVFANKDFKFLRLVEQKEIDSTLVEVMKYHKECVERGFEGAMIKNPKMPYSFGRSDAIVKVKTMLDADLKVIGFKEGTGRHEERLGAIIVDFNGVDVSVGSGFDDETRETVWQNQEKFLGMTAEVSYQELTTAGPDASLRFPVFKCWRLDK